MMHHTYSYEKVWNRFLTEDTGYSIIKLNFAKGAGQKKLTL